MNRFSKNTDDIKYILDNLRKADRIEIRKLYGKTYKQKAFNILNNADFDILIGKSDKPVVMGGVWVTDKKAPSVACVWLLCTDEIKNNGVSLIREIKKELRVIDDKYWLTYNILHKSNKDAKKWLVRLGFKFDLPALKGVDIPKGFEFFYRIRDFKGMGE